MQQIADFVRYSFKKRGTHPTDRKRKMTQAIKHFVKVSRLFPWPDWQCQCEFRLYFITSACHHKDRWLHHSEWNQASDCQDLQDRLQPPIRIGCQKENGWEASCCMNSCWKYQEEYSFISFNKQASTTDVRGSSRKDWPGKRNSSGWYSQKIPSLKTSQSWSLRMSAPYNAPALAFITCACQVAIQRPDTQSQDTPRSYTFGRASAGTDPPK